MKLGNDSFRIFDFLEWTHLLKEIILPFTKNYSFLEILLFEQIKSVDSKGRVYLKY